MYETVYDLQRLGYEEWWFPAAGVGFLALFTIILVVKRLLARRRNVPASSRSKLWIPIVFAAFWTVPAFWSTYGEYRKVRAEMDAGRVSVVTGEIVNFNPLEAHQHDEYFEVNGQRFSYSDYAITPGFKQIAAHGGPLHNGLNVRLTHVNGVIVRLEIAK